MRSFVVLTVVAACADEPPAPVAMSLADGDHVPVGQVELHVTLRDHHMSGEPVLAIDGEAPAFAVTTVPLTQDFMCPECADFLLRWPAVEVSAGTHEVTVGSSIGAASATVTFDNEPALRRIAPLSLDDLEGVGRIDLRLGVISRDPVTATLDLDGAVLEQLAGAACRTECEISHQLDTLAPSAGHHALTLAGTAADGAASRLDMPLELRDVVQVHGLEMNSVSIDLGLTDPDIEVYLFDESDNHRLLGCTPPLPGTIKAHVHYDLAANLGSPTGLPLFEVLRDLPADHQLRFEVWEDDDGMECPALPDPNRPDANADDFLGKSTAMTMASWRTAPVQSFGEVGAIELVVGRSLVR